MSKLVCQIIKFSAKNKISLLRKTSAIVSFKTSSQNCNLVIFKMSNGDATTIIGKTGSVPGTVTETDNDQNYVTNPAKDEVEMTKRD